MAIHDFGSSYTFVNIPRGVGAGKVDGASIMDPHISVYPVGASQSSHVEGGRVPNNWEAGRVESADIEEFLRIRSEGHPIQNLSFSVAIGDDFMEKLLEGDERYSYDNFIGDDKWVDIQSGIIFGFRINKWFGLFSEYNYQSYWGREIQEIKTGINIKF